MLKDMAMPSRKTLLKPLKKCSEARKSHDSFSAAALSAAEKVRTSGCTPLACAESQGLQFRDFEPKAVFFGSPYGWKNPAPYASASLPLPGVP
jgi:hypothetical protein